MSAVFDWLVGETIESAGLRGKTKSVFPVSAERSVSRVFRQTEESENDER